jgi:quercetin dioxygenase-like cupin family protein
MTTGESKLGTAIYTKAADAKEAEGRRAYFKYKEYGIKEATNGRMQVTETRSIAGLGQSTGWHYHTCEFQMFRHLEGWVDIEFEDGREIRVEAGDVVYIPGGYVHNEVRASDVFRGFEVFIPADFDTVPVDIDEIRAARAAKQR